MVIIGLIVAGTLAAQSLIRSAKLSATINEANHLKVAVNAFRLEYNQLPGDFDEATDYFGATDSAGNTVYEGNNDKKICCVGSGYIGFVENYSFFQHLGLASLISGQFSYPSSVSNVIPGINVPEAPTNSDDGWWVMYSGMYGHGLTLGNIHTLFGREGNLLSIGDSSQVNHLNGGVLTAKDSRSIDLKIDDGDPDGGDFYSMKVTNSDGYGWVSGCIDSLHTNVNGSSEYIDLDSNQEHCRPIWWFN